MFNDDDSFGGNLLGTVLLGGLFWLHGQSVRNSTIKEIRDAAESLELERLRREVEALKKQIP